MSNNAETFAASRWTKGNLFFPTRITVTPQHVSRVKPCLFGSSEESIAIGKVASVQISTGIIWSEIRIDSSRCRPDHQSWPPQSGRTENSGFDRGLPDGAEKMRHAKR